MPISLLLLFGTIKQNQDLDILERVGVIQTSTKRRRDFALNAPSCQQYCSIGVRTSLFHIFQVFGCMPIGYKKLNNLFEIILFSYVIDILLSSKSNYIILYIRTYSHFANSHTISFLAIFIGSFGEKNK